jgi:sodium-dependent dicarboxylate transporter 2/3/5
MWWMTEAVPLAATALLPLVLFPGLGIGTINATATSYVSPLIFLFLGGFLMAKSMVKQHLSQRIAFSLLKFGSLSPSGIIASMMIATAFFKSQNQRNCAETHFLHLKPHYRLWF